MHAAVGSIKFKSVFHLTRDALFSYFSILRAETVTPLSGELKWDCLLWYNAHISPSVHSLFYHINAPHISYTGLSSSGINQPIFVVIYHGGHMDLYHWHVNHPLSDVMNMSMAISRQLLFPWQDFTRAELSRDKWDMQPFLTMKLPHSSYDLTCKNVTRWQKTAPGAHSRNHTLRAAQDKLHFNSPWAAVPLVLNTLAIKVATYQIIVLLPTRNKPHHISKCPFRWISHCRVAQDKLRRAGILVFLLTEPWTLFHRRFPLSLPLSSALLSHPETDQLRQWEESRRRRETKHEPLDTRGPASALVSLTGVGSLQPLVGYLCCRFLQFHWCIKLPRKFYFHLRLNEFWRFLLINSFLSPRLENLNCNNNSCLVT